MNSFCNTFIEFQLKIRHNRTSKVESIIKISEKLSYPIINLSQFIILLNGIGWYTFDLILY